jgi:regulator of sigma D
MPGQQKHERRAESHKQIETLVSSRTDTLALYSKLAASKPFAPNKSTQKLLQEFCESLIDYTASAHFQLYRYIDERKERRKPVMDVAEQVYPGIADSTQKILDFNDKYDCEDHCNDFNQLEGDLSTLGVVLADRLELEDRLISILTRPRPG